MVLKLIKRRTDELKLLLILSGCLLVLAEIMFHIIMNCSNDDESTFAIGAAIIAMISLFYFVFMGAFGYGIEFNLAIGMGVTRKQFVPAYAISTLVMVLFQTGIIYLVLFLERWECSILYTTLPYERSLEGILFSYRIIPVVFLVTAVQIFVGSMSMKFGKKAFWVIWAIMMLSCMLPSRFEKAMKNADGSIFDRGGHAIVNAFSSINSTTIVIIMVVITVVFFVASYLVQMKQAYKNV